MRIGADRFCSRRDARRVRAAPGEWQRSFRTALLRRLLRVPQRVSACKLTEAAKSRGGTVKRQGRCAPVQLDASENQTTHTCAIVAPNVTAWRGADSKET